MAPALQVVDRISPTSDPDEEGPAPGEVEAPEPDDDETADDGPDWA